MARVRATKQQMEERYQAIINFCFSEQARSVPNPHQQARS